MKVSLHVLAQPPGGAPLLLSEYSDTLYFNDSAVGPLLILTSLCVHWSSKDRAGFILLVYLALQLVQ